MTNDEPSVESTREKERESFLLKELDFMEAEIKRLRAEGPARLQFLFTMTSAMLASLLVLAGLKTIDIEWARRGGIAVSLLLFALALVTYHYLIGRDISCDRNARGTARIRRYFLDRSPSLEPHVSWQTTDGPTKWLREDNSGIRNATVLIAAGLDALAVGLLTFELAGDPWTSYVSGLVTAAVTVITMRLWAKRRLAAAVQRAEAERRF